MQTATALGLESIDVKGADQKKSHAMPGILSKKKIAETPVPTETVVVPVTTAPAVAVSGMELLSCAAALLFATYHYLPVLTGQPGRQHVNTHIPASIDRLHEGQRSFWTSIWGHTFKC